MNIQHYYLELVLDFSIDLKFQRHIKLRLKNVSFIVSKTLKQFYFISNNFFLNGNLMFGMNFSKINFILNKFNFLKIMSKNNYFDSFANEFLCLK